MFTAQMQPQANSFQNGTRPMNPTAIQRKKPNRTGLPDHLKTGIENLSGYNMDNVRIHYNSSKPAQLQALAYTQGTDIHVAPGQEKHLPHEAWHVVQQMQGRVRPTMHLGNTAVNDDPALEHEAHAMGDMAMHGASQTAPIQRRYIKLTPCVQREKGDLSCEATVSYQGRRSTKATGYNNAGTAANVLATFREYNLPRLAAVPALSNAPGACAEPHAVAKALKNAKPTAKVKKIHITPANFTTPCKNRVAYNLLHKQLESGEIKFAQALLRHKPHPGDHEESRLIKQSDATYPPCTTCAQWISDNGFVKEDYLGSP